METLALFWQYLVLVFTNGFGIATLIAGGIDLIERFFNKEAPAIPTKWRLAIIVLLLVSAQFLAYKTTVDDAQQRLAKKQVELDQQTKPGLTLAIDELGVGGFAAGRQGEQYPAVFIIANLTNVGAPSSADRWILRIILRDGRSTDAQAVYLNPRGIVQGTNPNWKMSQVDALYVKAANAIQRGERIRGILIFIAKGGITRKELESIGTTYRLSCVDVNGTRIQASHSWVGVQQPHHYFPGLAPIPR